MKEVRSWKLEVRRKPVSLREVSFIKHPQALLGGATRVLDGATQFCHLDFVIPLAFGF